MSNCICYWRGSAEVREDIIRGLVELQIDVLQVRRLEELLDAMVKVKFLAILVDGSAAQREASDRIIDIANTEKLRDEKIFFLSPQASKRIAVLKSRADTLYPINVPYLTAQVIEGFKCFVALPGENPQNIAAIMNAHPEAQGSSLPQESASISPIVDPTENLHSDSERSTLQDLNEITSLLENTFLNDNPEPLSESQISSPTGATAIRKLRQTVEDNSAASRARLRENRDPANLKNSYGGQVFSIASQLEDFDDHALLPNVDIQARQNAKDLLDNFSKRDPWASLQARRAAFVGASMAKALALDSPQSNNVRFLTLFLNCADSPFGKGIRRFDYLRTQTTDSQDALMQSFRSSGKIIEERFHLERTSQTLELIEACLTLNNSPKLLQHKLRPEAEIVLLAELAGRSCWGEGFWNPYGAYRTAHFLTKENSIFKCEPVILAFRRILAEAVSSHVTVHNIFSGGDYSEELSRKDGQSAFRLRAYQPAPGKRVRALKISLADLSPGMRLAQPVKARDGRLVLDSDVKLNQAIVFQLWQLAAIRALQNSVSIQVEV